MGNVFFYAEDEPELYDATAPLTERTYELGHDALKYVLTELFTHRLTRNASPARFLDLGCGTGKECLPILGLDSRVKLTAIDSSIGMLDLLRRKIAMAYGEETLTSRVRLIEADFSLSNWNESVASHDSPFDFVVAAHSLHHLSPDQKRALYRSAVSLLRADGVLLILDLFDYADDFMSRLASQSLVDWLEAQLSDTSISADHAGLFPLARRRMLRERWVRHVLEENSPLPLSASTPDSTPHTEIEFLAEAGVSQIEVPFRWFQSALVVARK